MNLLTADHLTTWALRPTSLRTVFGNPGVVGPALAFVAMLARQSVCARSFSQRKLNLLENILTRQTETASFKAESHDPLDKNRMFHPKTPPSSAVLLTL